MRALLKQTSNGVTSSFRVDGKCNVTVHPLSAEFDNGYIVTQSIDPRTCDIRNSDGVRIGYLRKEIALLASTRYAMNIVGTEFTAVSIGMWKKGNYWPIYAHGAQVALIHKNTVVADNLDEYELYALSDKDMDAAILLAVFIDMREYRNFAQYTRRKVSVNLSWTLSRKVRKSLDLGFIDRC